jgi:two-component system C4-dicarboxylate transport sensor histidine kinase DctB
VKGDAVGLLRILLNLILNSERAVIDARGGLITFAAEAGPETARLVIEDSGPGVAPGVERFLFHLLGEDGRLTTGLWTAARLAALSGATISWLGPAGRPSAFELVLASGR